MSNSTPRTMFQNGMLPKTVDEFIAQLDIKYPHPKIERENMQDSHIRQLIIDMAQREVVEDILQLQARHYQSFNNDLGEK